VPIRFADWLSRQPAIAAIATAAIAAIGLCNSFAEGF